MYPYTIFPEFTTRCSKLSEELYERSQVAASHFMYEAINVNKRDGKYLNYLIQIRQHSSTTTKLISRPYPTEKIVIMPCARTCMQRNIEMKPMQLKPKYQHLDL